MNNTEFFKQAKFGMFIHWGLYSLPAGEWKGKRTEFPGEWVMTYNRIPVKELAPRLPGTAVCATNANPHIIDTERSITIEIILF